MGADVSGKVVVVTGAAQGIGEAVTRRFAEEGAAVVASARDQRRAREATAGLTARGLRVLPVNCDVTRKEDVEAMVAAAVDAFGKIDVLVNNAGWVGSPTPSESRPEEDVVRALDTGPKGTILCSQAAFPHLRESRGTIINFGSVAALAGSPLMVEHSAAKGAVMAITKTLALEWAQYGIRVNALAPTALTPGVQRHHEEVEKMSAEIGAEAMSAGSAQAEVPLMPLGPVGDPYETVTPAVVFLASEGAGWITGQTISVDGGLYLM